MKDELGGQVMKKVVGFRAKTYSYLKDYNDEDKKTKGNEKCVIKRKTIKNVQKHLKLKIKQTIQKRKKYVDIVEEDQKEFLKGKLIIKTQQRFKSKRDNTFTEEINKIALSLNDGKRMQSIDSMETYAYGTSKDLICKKEKIKRYDIIKQYKKVLL